MEALVKALGEGDAICLFPEGMSRYHPSVAPMKTGGKSLLPLWCTSLIDFS